MKIQFPQIVFDDWVIKINPQNVSRMCYNAVFRITHCLANHHMLPFMLLYIVIKRRYRGPT